MCYGSMPLPLRRYKGVTEYPYTCTVERCIRCDSCFEASMKAYFSSKNDPELGVP